MLQQFRRFTCNVCKKTADAHYNGSASQDLPGWVEFHNFRKAGHGIHICPDCWPAAEKAIDPHKLCGADVGTLDIEHAERPE
jgi:hypothetical protein